MRSVASACAPCALKGHESHDTAPCARGCTIGAALSCQRTGTLGQIALQSPQHGSDDVSYVELRFQLLDAGTGAPTSLERFHVSFYDFDGAHTTNEHLTGAGQVAHVACACY